MKKPNNNHDDLILYRHPLDRMARPRRRGYGVINFNDRSPESLAMKAHLRASAYKGDRENEPASPVGRGRSIATNQILPFLHLRRRYDEQARRNFIRDGVLLAIIVAISVWAVIHAVQAMAGS